MKFTPRLVAILGMVALLVPFVASADTGAGAVSANMAPWLAPIATLCGLLAYAARVLMPRNHWLHDQIGAVALAGAGAIVGAALSALASYIASASFDPHAIPLVLVNAGISAAAALIGAGNPSNGAPPAQPPVQGKLLLGLLLPLGCLSMLGCKASPQVAGLTVAIASVQSIDEGIAAYAAAAPGLEQRIAADAVAACKGSPSREAYTNCTHDFVAPRRAPHDKTRTAIAVYRATLAAGSGVAEGDVLSAGAAVVAALGEFGIHVGAPR